MVLMKPKKMLTWIRFFERNRKLCKNLFELFHNECPLRGGKKRAELMVNLLYAISRPHALIGFWGFLLPKKGLGKSQAHKRYGSGQVIHD
jgi:hypothetical protein